MQTINQDLASSYPPPPVSRNMGNHSELMIFSVKAGEKRNKHPVYFSVHYSSGSVEGEICDATTKLRIPISSFSSL